MERAKFSLEGAATGSLIPRKQSSEMPEFDITAMVDLVFMMNIYFLVTFVMVSLAEVNLPTARHVEPLDSDTAVVLTLIGSLDGQSIDVRVGEGDQAEMVPPAEQEERITSAVVEGAADGKTAVLIKAEKKVRLSDLFRVATAAAASEGLKLHVAVVEADEPL